jgi:hypothetical protein
LGLKINNILARRQDLPILGTTVNSSDGLLFQVSNTVYTSPVNTGLKNLGIALNSYNYLNFVTFFSATSVDA